MRSTRADAIQVHIHFPRLQGSRVLTNAATYFFLPCSACSRTRESAAIISDDRSPERNAGPRFHKRGYSLLRPTAHPFRQPDFASAASYSRQNKSQ